MLTVVISAAIGYALGHAFPSQWVKDLIDKIKNN